ncbi:MAG: hypothetical protein GY720_00020, partial [bacterium]|nr:hypothetical protein [bacterium]
ASVISSIVIDNGSNYEAMAIAFPVEPNRSPSFNQDLADRADPEGTVISLSAAAGDADTGDTLSYLATGLPQGLSIHPGSGLISGTIDFLAVGTYPVAISVTDDGIPNLSDIDTFTWTITDMNQPPSFDQDIGDQADAEGSAVTLSAAATDPDGSDLLTYAAIGLPNGLTIDDGSGLISGTIDYSASSGSPFAVTITATDNGVPNLGATPDTFFWTVANTNRPPTVGNPGAQTTPELAPFTLVITASDPDGDTPGFSDGGTLPAWAALVDNLDGTATILGTPGAGDSATTAVTITASDGGIPDLSDGAVFDLTVTNTNVPPTIINPGNQAVPEGAPFNLLISGADADGTTVSFTDGGSLPGWATLVDNGDNTATIAGTPGYTDAALTTVTITASDGSLSIDAVFDLTVTDTNRSPSIGSIGLQVVAEASALIPIMATTSDPDGTIPGLSASGLPGWASFLDNGDGTGTVTGTPGYTDAALSTVT